jgi:hypothetical protein
MTCYIATAHLYPGRIKGPGRHTRVGSPNPPFPCNMVGRNDPPYGTHRPNADGQSALCSHCLKMGQVEKSG